MTRFDSFVMLDWSGGNDRGPAPKADAIWVCFADRDGAREPVYLRNRALAESWLATCIESELSAGRRLCIGVDFPFGYPVGFSGAIVGADGPLALWDWFEHRIEDTAKTNNRFDLAAQINRQFGGRGPFWANGLKRDITGLPRTKCDYDNPFPDRRAVEHLAQGSFTCWQMAGAGAVGSQIFMGLPVLARLRHRFAERVAVWPFETLEREVAFVEVWPSLTVGPGPETMVKDAWQVQQVALSLAQRSPSDLCSALDITAPEEGWILDVPQDNRKQAA